MMAFVLWRQKFTHGTIRTFYFQICHTIIQNVAQLFYVSERFYSGKAAYSRLWSRARYTQLLQILSETQGTDYRVAVLDFIKEMKKWAALANADISTHFSINASVPQ